MDIAPVPGGLDRCGSVLLVDLGGNHPLGFGSPEGLLERNVSRKVFTDHSVFINAGLSLSDRSASDIAQGQHRASGEKDCSSEELGELVVCHDFNIPTFF